MSNDLFVSLQAVLIPKNAVVACLEAINALQPAAGRTAPRRPGPYWALQEALTAWNFEVATGAQGVYLRKFAWLEWDSTPPLWERAPYEVLLGAIAPYVQPNAEIMVIDRDEGRPGNREYERYHYTFGHGRLRARHARVHWAPEPSSIAEIARLLDRARFGMDGEALARARTLTEIL